MTCEHSAIGKMPEWLAQEQGGVFTNRSSVQVVQCGGKRPHTSGAVVPSQPEIFVHSQAHPPVASSKGDWDSISASAGQVSRFHSAQSCEILTSEPLADAHVLLEGL